MSLTLAPTESVLSGSCFSHIISDERCLSIYLFTCGFFNDTPGSTDYKMINNLIWKGMEGRSCGLGFAWKK
jgi:hypothetical protein